MNTSVSSRKREVQLPKSPSEKRGNHHQPLFEHWSRYGRHIKSYWRIQRQISQQAELQFKNTFMILLMRIAVDLGMVALGMIWGWTWMMDTQVMMEVMMRKKEDHWRLRHYLKLKKITNPS